MKFEWLENMNESHAGEHPNAKSAYDKNKQVTVREKPVREGGSLDLGKFALSTQNDRGEKEPLVEAPRRANGLGTNSRTNSKPMHLRLPEELERFIYSNTQGSVNAVCAALFVYAFQQLQANGQKLVLEAVTETNDATDENTDAAQE